jgi:hypothetical protein
MDEEIRYPVCPHRNVAAAYQRFLGPDSGGFERFFHDERTHRVDGTLLIVRLRGSWALAGAVHDLQRAARNLSEAIAELNPALTRSWASASWAVSVFVWLGAASCRAFMAKALKEFHGLHLRLPLLLGLRHDRLPV